MQQVEQENEEMKEGKSHYYWIRVYDYVIERDQYHKGTMLDEFYLKDVVGGREEVKKKVKERYASPTSSGIKFAKPKKQDGLYAIIMDSNKFFYDRFTVQLDTLCFYCYQPIQGKASEFPRAYIGEKSWYDSNEENTFTDQKQTAFFCTHDCRSHFYQSQRKDTEGEFQEKEAGQKGEVFGYIYLIYNRAENTYYIGQTRYMPFFRWQEHVKDGSKGDISDLSFSVLAEVYRHSGQDEKHNQQYLNNMEAWWIAKYQEEGHQVFNITKPRLTLQELKERFHDMVLRKQG